MSDDTRTGTEGTMVSRRADLVMEGGGVKGIGLLGAVVELARQGWTFPRVAGTSAGAIVGSLVAACLHTGRDVGSLVEVMERLDYQKFRDPTFLGRFGPVGQGLDLLVHDGVYRGEYLLEWLEAELAKLGVRTFADLRIDDDPGTSLAPHERYRLVVMASDVSRGQLVRLPWDYQRYGLVPDEQKVADAVRASMSVPFFFRPVAMPVSPGSGGGKVTLVDGGMLSNFPIETFDRTDGRPPRWPTIGLKLSARPAARQVGHPVDGPFDLALACLHTLLDAHDAYHLDDLRVTERTVFIDTATVSSLDFDIDAEQQRQLYESGRAAAAAFLTTSSTPVTPATSATQTVPAVPTVPAVSVTTVEPVVVESEQESV
ncbi:MAG TPA: patatin-like phospholipase family protein [Mycobacteriales bacterium]